MSGTPASPSASSTRRSFAFKPALMAVLALGALVGVGLYATQLPLASPLGARRTGADSRRRGREPASIARGRGTSWTSSTSTGVAGTSGRSTWRTPPSAVGVGHPDPRSCCGRPAAAPRGLIEEARVFPELFKLGPVTVYTYGVLLAAAYLLGLQLAMSRAKSARPRSEPRARPRHRHHHLRAGRRQAAARARRLRSLPAESRPSCSRSSAPAACSTAA